MIDSLIPKSSFTGLDGIAHLATGGESPMLHSHRDAMQQFMLDKSSGEPARDLQHAVLHQARLQCAALFKVPATDVTFLSSATEGINTLCYGLSWSAGDNVVVADVEFPSDILPWANLQQHGVEVRIVRHKDWVISEQEILDQIDENTKVVAVSQVSMFTGQHMDVAKLSSGIRSAGAIFLMDVTHAAGVVPVDASLADIAVSSCYKWMLGTHGTAVFYWNRNTLPDLAPPFIGWASVASGGGWQSPLDYTLHNSADRFLSANPSYLSLYVLNNALHHLAEHSEDAIQQHARALGAEIYSGLAQFNLELMTPAEDHRRAGNICFMVENVNSLRMTLGELGVLVWGAYGQFGRVRISAHVHNDSEDVSRLLTALDKVL